MKKIIEQKRPGYIRSNGEVVKPYSIYSINGIPVSPCCFVKMNVQMNKNRNIDFIYCSQCLQELDGNGQPLEVQKTENPPPTPPNLKKDFGG